MHAEAEAEAEAETDTVRSVYGYCRHWSVFVLCCVELGGVSACVKCMPLSFCMCCLFVLYVSTYVRVCVRANVLCMSNKASETKPKKKHVQVSSDCVVNGTEQRRKMQ